MMSSARDGKLSKSAWNLAAEASLECWREPVYKKIYLFFVFFYLLRDYASLTFPNFYPWTEAFINYEGGFMRRGLFGQLLYYAAPWVNIRFMVLAACTIVFLVFLRLAWSRMSGTFDKLTTILIFITPSYFLFYVKDYNAFLRKDLFINLFALITVLATVRSLKGKDRQGLWLPTAIFVLCFVIAFLIHETTVFYFTLPAWLLGLIWARQKKTWLWVVSMAALFLFSGYVAITWPGTAENARAITESWQKYLPDFAGKGALLYLGMPVSEQLAKTSLWHNDAVAIRSAIWGLFLSLLPLVWIVAVYRPFASMRKHFSTFMLCLLPLAAAGPWALPVIATDFGRHIALGSIQYLLALWAIVAVLGLAPVKWLDSLLAEINSNARVRIIALATLAFFGTSWTLLAWAPLGHSSVVLAGIPDIVAYIIKPY